MASRRFARTCTRTCAGSAADGRPDVLARTSTHFFLPPTTTMLSSTLRRTVLKRPGLALTQSTRNRISHYPQFAIAHFSTDSSSKEEKKDTEETDSLRDTVNRLKNNNSSSSTTSNDDLLRKAADLWETAKSEISLTWQELLNAGKPKSINKKILPEETEEGNQEYTGSVDIMVIDESEHLTAWERMQRRLTDAPIIQGNKHECIVL